MLKKFLAKLGIYSRLQMNLAFEFGYLLTDVCQQQNIALDREKMIEVEKTLAIEFGSYTPAQFSRNIPMLILAILQEFSPELKDVDNMVDSVDINIKK